MCVCVYRRFRRVRVCRLVLHTYIRMYNYWLLPTISRKRVLFGSLLGVEVARGRGGAARGGAIRTAESGGLRSRTRPPARSPVRPVERTALFLPQWKSVVLKSHGGGGGGGGSTTRIPLGEIYRRGDDIGCCGAGTVAVGNRSDAIMCKARAFTIRARPYIYTYNYIYIYTVCALIPAIIKTERKPVTRHRRDVE